MPAPAPAPVTIASLAHDPALIPDPAGVDKTVVDRRSAHRSSGSRIAMRDARRGMQADIDEPTRFRDELLEIHARLVVAARWPALGLPLLLAGLLAPFLALPGRVALALWCVLALGSVALGEWNARRFLAGTAKDRRHLDAAARFTLVQAAQGVAWAGFVLLAHPLVLGDWTTAPFVAAALPAPFLPVVLLLVAAWHLHSSHALAGGVAWVCVPPFLAIAVLLVRDAAAGDVVAAASLASAAVVAGCFPLVGNRLRAYARGNVLARMEKDHALLESEEAQSLSDEARRRAEEANMAKTRFLATMSHELRTPLNAILGFSELMEQEVLGPLGNAKYREYAADIHSSGSHLLKVINEILDLSRVEAGRYELQEEAIDLVSLVEGATQMVRLKANGKNLRIETRAERALPRVWADERAVRQVVLNLLSNAVKFTPNGGRIIVKVGWTGSGGQYVSVGDTGPGIAAEEIPIVLAAFGQGAVALRSAEPGSGLGLPIVQAFMKLHDGRLDLKSRLREGTTATALFPRRRVMGDELAQPARPARPAFARAS